MSNELLSTEQAAKYLGYSPRTLKQSRTSDILCGVPAPIFRRIGTKTVRYKKTDLDAWVDEHANIGNKNEA